MKADRIIKNSKIFTSDKDKPEATALVVKDGKFADYLVFDQDLLKAEKDGFSNNKPTDVYFAGKKVN